MEKLLYALAVIVCSLIVGCLLRRCLPGRNLDNMRRYMQLFALFGCIPLSALLSLWGLPAPDVRLLSLPLMGLANWICGGLLALGAARILQLDRAQTGSMFCCGSFTNVGALGSLVAVLFLGEQSIALVSLYRLCEDFYYFAVAMPVAAYYGRNNGTCTQKKSLFAMLCNPVLLGVLLALGGGVFLNWIQIPRPVWGGTVASALVFIATALFLVAIGMSLRLSRMRVYTKQWLCVAGIKFFCTPVLIGGLATWVGLGQIDNALPLKTILILSCMPVAMNALVPPSLYRLDVDLANTCWICTTASLVVILPLLLLLLPYI